MAVNSIAKARRQFQPKGENQDEEAHDYADGVIGGSAIRFRAIAKQTVPLRVEDAIND